MYSVEGGADAFGVRAYENDSKRIEERKAEAKLR